MNILYVLGQILWSAKPFTPAENIGVQHFLGFHPFKYISSHWFWLEFKPGPESGRTVAWICSHFQRSQWSYITAVEMTLKPWICCSEMNSNISLSLPLFCLRASHTASLQLSSNSTVQVCHCHFITHNFITALFLQYLRDELAIAQEWQSPCCSCLFMFRTLDKSCRTPSHWGMCMFNK